MLPARSIPILIIPAIALCACSQMAGDITPEQTLVSTERTEGLVARPTESVGEFTPVPEETIESTTTEIAPTTEPPAESAPAIRRIEEGAELVIQHITMIDQENGWAVGGANGRADSVLRTQDGGFSWMEVTPPEVVEVERPMQAVGSFINATTAWILFHPLRESQPGGVQQLRVWRTDDGGASWRGSTPASVEFIGAAHAPAWIHFEDPDQGWVLARYGGSGMHRYPVYLLYSGDGGGSWQTLEDPYEGMWLQSCPKTGWDWTPSGAGIVTIGFCPFESAEVHLTVDSGRSWESIRLPIPADMEATIGYASCRAHSPIFNEAKDLMLASECPVFDDDPVTIHLIYTSQDLGASWESWEYPGGELHPVEGDVILALGREIFISEDRGLTWTLLKEVAWEGQFSFVGRLHGWAVARNEEEIALVNTIDGGSSWQLIEPALIQ